MHVLLRLKIEEKSNDCPYTPQSVSDITESIKEAVLRLKIKNPLFETLVKLEKNKVTYCQFKMSPTVWRFFLAAFGSVETIERDYEIYLV